MRKGKELIIGLLLVLVSGSICMAQELSIRVPFVGVGAAYPLVRNELGLHSMARSTNFHYTGLSYTWINKLRISADYSGETWKVNWLSAERAKEMTGVPISGVGFSWYVDSDEEANTEQLAIVSILLQKSWKLDWVEINLGPGLKYYWEGYTNRSSTLYFAGSKIYLLSGGYTYTRAVPYLGGDVIFNYKKRWAARCSASVLSHRQNNGYAQLQRLSGIAAPEVYELSGTGNDIRWELGFGLYYRMHTSSATR